MRLVVCDDRVLPLLVSREQTSASAPPVTAAVDPLLSLLCYQPDGLMCVANDSRRRVVYYCVSDSEDSFTLHAVPYVDTRSMLWGSRGIACTFQSKLICACVPREYPFVPLVSLWKSDSHAVVCGPTGFVSFTLASERWHLMRDAAQERSFSCVAGCFAGSAFVALVQTDFRHELREFDPSTAHCGPGVEVPYGRANFENSHMCAMGDGSTLALLVEDLLYVVDRVELRVRYQVRTSLGIPKAVCLLPADDTAAARLAVLCSDRHVYSVEVTREASMSLVASEVTRVWTARGGLALVRGSAACWRFRGVEESSWVCTDASKLTVGLSEDCLLMHSLERHEAVAARCLVRPTLATSPFASAVIAVHLTLGLQFPLPLLSHHPVARRGLEIVVYRALVAGDGDRVRAAFAVTPAAVRHVILLRVLRSADMDPHWEFLLGCLGTRASDQCRKCIELKEWDEASQWLRPVHLLEGPSLAQRLALQLLEAIVGVETGPAHYQLLADIVRFLQKFSGSSAAAWDVPLMQHGRLLLLGLKVSQLLYLQSLLAETDPEWLWRLFEEERVRSADRFDVWDGVAAICDQYGVPIPSLEDGRLQLTVSRFCKAELDVFLPLLVKVGCWKWAFAVATALLRLDALTSLLKHHPRLWEEAKAALPHTSPYLTALQTVETAATK